MQINAYAYMHFLYKHTQSKKTQTNIVGASLEVMCPQTWF